MITWQPSHPRSADIAASRWRSTRITVASLTSISTFQRVMCSRPSSWCSRLSRAREIETKCKAWLDSSANFRHHRQWCSISHIKITRWRTFQLLRNVLLSAVLCESRLENCFIAYTMYNSTRCYGIPYTYTVVSLCDRCFRVAVRGKGIILTSTTQNKLKIKTLLTVKSSMTSILSVWEHLNLLWKSTRQRNILWEIPDQPSLRPLLQPPSFGIARSCTRLKGFV